MTAAVSLVGSQGIVSATEVFLAAAIFCLVFLLIQSLRQHVPQGLKSPPGPRGYPILGNVLELRKDTHLALTRLSQKYGDVMEVRIGTMPVLVLSGLDTIKQALVKQGEDFMGRPDLHSFQYISNGQSLAFSPDSGEVWKARRKLAQNALKTFSIAPSPTSSSTCLLEEHVSKEADYLVTKFLQLMDEEKSFDLNRYLVVSVANIICAICFGKRYDHNDQELLSLVNLSNEFGDVAAAGNPADFIPVLQYLPSRTMQLFKDINRRFSFFVQKIVQEHYTSFDKVRAWMLLDVSRDAYNCQILPAWQWGEEGTPLSPHLCPGKLLGALQSAVNPPRSQHWLGEVSPALGVHDVPNPPALPQEHIRDITDSLIEHCQEKSAGEDARVPLSNEKIISIVNDLFGAGENILRVNPCCWEAGWGPWSCWGETLATLGCLELLLGSQVPS